MSACASTRRRGARRAAALPAGRARRPDASGAPWEPGVTGHCCGGHHTGARCVWLSRDKVSHDERTGRNAEPSAAAHAWHLQHDCAAPDRPQVGQTLSAWHSWVTDGADEALLTRRRNQPRGAQSFAQRSSAAGRHALTGAQRLLWGGSGARTGTAGQRAGRRAARALCARKLPRATRRAFSTAAHSKARPLPWRAGPRSRPRLRHGRCVGRVRRRASAAAQAAAWGQGGPRAWHWKGTVRSCLHDRSKLSGSTARSPRSGGSADGACCGAAADAPPGASPALAGPGSAMLRRRRRAGPRRGCALAAMTRNLKLGPRTGACVSASCCVHAAAARRAGCGAPRRRRARALGGIMRIPELRRSPRRMRRGLDAQRGSRRRPRRRCRQAAPRQRAPQLQPKAPPR